jgi:integrase
VTKKIKYVPPSADIDKALCGADQDIKDYLMAVKDTMARVSEINRLTWDDVDLESKYLVLYTRKKKGGHLTPRKVPMTQRLHEILCRRYSARNSAYPWVFCNTYVDWKTGKKVTDQFKYRSTILKTLCEKAGVKRFSFHALRHSGASILDNMNVPLGTIQKILGHENRTTTEIYLHSIGSSEKEAISIFEAATQKSHIDSHTDVNQ